MKINWNFLGGGGLQNKKPSVEGVWIFSGTAHYIHIIEKLLLKSACATINIMINKMRIEIAYLH